MEVVDVANLTDVTEDMDDRQRKEERSGGSFYCCYQTSAEFLKFMRNHQVNLENGERL